MAYTSHQVWSIAFYLSILAMLESEKFPFPSYFYFASFDRGEEPITFLLARKMRQNATKQVTKIILGSKNQLTVILNVCWNWCHPLKHLLIKCCCKPSFSKPVHFASLWKDCEICICKQALCIIWSLKSKDFKIPLLPTYIIDYQGRPCWRTKNEKKSRSGQSQFTVLLLFCLAEMFRLKESDAFVSLFLRHSS